MKLTKELEYFSRSLRICGLFPCPKTDEKKRTGRHIYPIVLCIITWMNTARISTHLIWLSETNMINILSSGLIILYCLVSALLRTTYTVANMKAGYYSKALKRLTMNDCPMRDELEAYKSHGDSFRRFLINLLHFYGWFYVIVHNCFIVSSGIFRRDYEVVQFILSPFTIGCDTVYYVGIGVVSICLAVTDSGIIFANTFIVVCTIELTGKFNSLIHWIKSKTIPPELQLKSGGLQTADFDINGIRLAHLYWLLRVKEYDRLYRCTMGITMMFAFYALLSSIYLMIWGDGGFLITLGYVLWAWTAFFLMFCHLFASAFLNKTTEDVAEVVYQVPTQKMFQSEQKIANFLLFINQCTSEPISLTFFDLFHLRNQAVMAVCFFDFYF